MKLKANCSIEYGIASNWNPVTHQPKNTSNEKTEML
jgi:hypothetical protein